MLHPYRELYLGGGLPRTLHQYFSKLQGIQKAECGSVYRYRAEISSHSNPSPNVSQGCLLRFDPRILHPAEIFYHFFRLINPTTRNRQGRYFGHAYRNLISARDVHLLCIAEHMMPCLQRRYRDPLEIEITPLKYYVRLEHSDSSPPCCPEEELSIHPMNDPLMLHIEPIHPTISTLSSVVTPCVLPTSLQPPMLPCTAMANLDHQGLYLDARNASPLFSSQDLLFSTASFLYFRKPLLTTSIVSEAQATIGRILSPNLKHPSSQSCPRPFSLEWVSRQISASPVQRVYCVHKEILLFLPIEEIQDSIYDNYLIFLE